MSTFNVAWGDIPLTVEKSKKRRRSVALKITKEGIIVQAPFLYPEKQILQLLEKRKDWIEKNWEKILKKNTLTEKTFQENSLLPHLWKRYPLRFRYWGKKSIKFWLSDTEFMAYINKIHTQEQIHKGYEKWLKSKAKSYLEAKTRELSIKFWLVPQHIFIKKYTSKYGMCKWKDVYFSFTILELPEPVIEHIILHELTHLIYKHHQPSFRKKLSELDPNWKKHKNILKWKEDESI